MSLSGHDWLSPVVAAGPLLSARSWGLQQDIAPRLPHCSPLLPRVLLGAAPSCCSLPISIRLHLLENTVQKSGETWESISLPLDTKQSRVVSGFAELVAGIFLPVLSPQAPLLPLKKKKKKKKFPPFHWKGASCWVNHRCGFTLRAVCHSAVGLLSR